MIQYTHKTNGVIMSIGILVHGRHLDSHQWEYLVWGNPPHQMGSLPRMVQLILNRGLDTVDIIVLGTGSSEKDGLKESEHIQNFFERHWHTLLDFESIKNHPAFPEDFGTFCEQIIRKIHCDTITRNTREEVAYAADYLKDCSEVIQITSSSHASRCIKESAILMEEGSISPTQMWSILPDLTPFAETSVREVFISEPPHRGDDPFRSETVRPNMVFPQFYQIKNHESRMQVLRDLKDSLERNE